MCTHLCFSCVSIKHRKTKKAAVVAALDSCADDRSNTYY
jgi:hypothetical protein